MERSILKYIKDMHILIGEKITYENDPKAYFNHTQIQILLYLIKHKNEEVCQKDLEIETHLKKASITGTLDSLQDKGIIIRKQSEDDKRKNIILLSDKALKLKDNISEKYKEIESKIRENITEEELNQFYSVFDKMERNLRKE